MELKILKLLPLFDLYFKSLSVSCVGVNGTLECRVYCEDTDFGGVVYYANYLKFAERGRTEMLYNENIDQNELSQNDIFFVVRNCELEYLHYAKYGDTIEIETTITEIKNSSMKMKQLILRKKDKKELCKINVILVCVKKDEGGIFKAQKLPDFIRDKLMKYVQIA